LILSSASGAADLSLDGVERAELTEEERGGEASSSSFFGFRSTSSAVEDKRERAEKGAEEDVLSFSSFFGRRRGIAGWRNVSEEDATVEEGGSE
jgi:hypothetical protein